MSFIFLQLNSAHLYLHLLSSETAVAPSHSTMTLAFSQFSSLLTLSPLCFTTLCAPLHHSIIVTSPLTLWRSQLLLTQHFRQPIYTVAGHIYLLESDSPSAAVLSPLSCICSPESVWFNLCIFVSLDSLLEARQMWNDNNIKNLNKVCDQVLLSISFLLIHWYWENWTQYHLTMFCRQFIKELFNIRHLVKW